VFSRLFFHLHFAIFDGIFDGIEDGHWGEKQVLEVEMKNQISVKKKRE